MKCFLFPYMPKTNRSLLFPHLNTRTKGRYLKARVHCHNLLKFFFQQILKCHSTDFQNPFEYVLQNVKKNQKTPLPLLAVVQPTDTTLGKQSTSYGLLGHSQQSNKFLVLYFNYFSYSFLLITPKFIHINLIAYFK